MKGWEAVATSGTCVSWEESAATPLAETVRVLGIGGTTRSGSTTELALTAAISAANAAGACTALLGAADLELPLYSPDVSRRDERATRLIELVEQADGLILASPGYHGGMSGRVKNALDYLEDLRGADRPYLEGRAVGCIICAQGWQASVTALQALRATVHALRGWPTPLGIALNSADRLFDPDGSPASPDLAARFAVLGKQVVEFAQARAVVR
jgi:FMN reductase